MSRDGFHTQSAIVLQVNNPLLEAQRVLCVYLKFFRLLKGDHSPDTFILSLQSLVLHPAIKYFNISAGQPLNSHILI